MKNNYTKHSTVIVAHKFLSQPDDELFTYLNEKKMVNVMQICHSFNEAADRVSYYSWYKKGKVHKEYKSRDYKNLPEPLLYLKEFFFTVKFILQSGVAWDTYIGMDGLCVFFGTVLKLTGRVKKTVFWVIDFVPKGRFSSKWKEKIYHSININSDKHADEVWDLSPRMAEAREINLGLSEADYKTPPKIVPYGVWLDKIKKYSYAECEKNTLVYMGLLIEKQGVQYVINCIPEIVKKFPAFKFKIIGGGEYSEELKKLAAKLNVEKYCNFVGRVPNNEYERLQKEIASSCVAIAPYVKELDTWTYYADPGKVKTYLSCGVPVLLTDLPWNSQEIEQHKCGKLISLECEDILEKLTVLMDPVTNQKYRENAVMYAKSFDYGNMFDSLGL